jgi:hypothetical protein
MANAQDIEAMRDWLSKQPHLPEKIGKPSFHLFSLTKRISILSLIKLVNIV